MAMNKGFFSSAVMAIILASASAAEAGIYKWQDEEGTWHFSETPPMSQPAEKISVKTVPPSSEPEQDTEDSEPENEEPGTADELPLSPEIVAAEKARKDENCKKARENLKNLLTGERIRFRDETQGEVRYLSAEEREEWKKKSQKLIAESCQ